ncbi:MAG: type I secretion system permease/ATPase [Vampirovibrionales bacterium]|nr:type I secretion system permease/ATPase [Vampirovibrionales bacterium]
MQTGLIAFDAIAKLSHIAVDLRAIAREHGLASGEIPCEELLRIIQQSGFRAKRKTLEPEALENRYPLPAIALCEDGTYKVLLKINALAKKCLMYIPGHNGPCEWTLDELQAQTHGEFIILRSRQYNEYRQFGFRWFFEEIIKFRQVIAEVMIGSFFVQLFGLVTPLFTQVILDKVLVHHSLTTLNVLAVAFVGVTGFELLLNLSRNYIFTHTANKIDAKLGAKLFRHLFNLPYAYFESRPVGVIIARIRELDAIREFITNKSVTLMVDLLFSVVFVVMMALYSVPLTLLTLGFIVAIGLIYLIGTPAFRARLNTKFQMMAQSNSYLVESVTGVETVKSLAVEGAMQRKWEDYLGRYLGASFRLSALGSILGSLSSCLQKLQTICLLFFGVKLVLDNQLTVGQLIAFQMFANQFTAPVLRLVNLWNDFQQTLLGVDRLGDILNNPIESASEKEITLPKINGMIRFDNVGFRYTPGGPQVLDNVTLTIAPGLSVGVVGRSGSGKSTLAKLIQRLYIPTDGSIHIDDMDIRHLNARWLRYQIGVVPQESYLFSGTIQENISLPKPEAPMEEIIHVARLAGAHEFIAQLPDGYDTPVGERGSSLSGGQKQRIAIARALMTQPRILIFDEATSALDYESERVIQRNMKKIAEGRTMVIIAHRLSSVRHCDLIIAMDRGKVVEMGAHDELVGMGGYYWNLLEMEGHD